MCYYYCLNCKEKGIVDCCRPCTNKTEAQYRVYCDLCFQVIFYWAYRRTPTETQTCN